MLQEHGAQTLAEAAFGHRACNLRRDLDRAASAGVEFQRLLFDHGSSFERVLVQT